MADIQTNLELRRHVSEADQDMRRANQRGDAAITALRRVTLLAESVGRVNLDEVNAAVEDLTTAQKDWRAARDRKAELRRLLGEE